MIYDGQRWVRSRSVVSLPHENYHGEHKNYVTFGRICKKNTKGAIQTGYKYRGMIPYHLFDNGKLPPHDGEEEGRKFWFVWAKPIKFTGHSRTNMMLAQDGSLYLLNDGQVYVRGKNAR